MSRSELRRKTLRATIWLLSALLDMEEQDALGSNRGRVCSTKRGLWPRRKMLIPTELDIARARRALRGEP